jgi:uncharacterized protein YuzE
MKIYYDDRSDLLYFRLDDKKQDVLNKRISDDIVLDIGTDEKIVGIEILNASALVKLENLLPIQYEKSNVFV